MILNDSGLGELELAYSAGASGIPLPAGTYRLTAAASFEADLSAAFVRLEIRTNPASSLQLRDTVPANSLYTTLETSRVVTVATGTVVSVSQQNLGGASSTVQFEGGGFLIEKLD